MYDYTSVLLQEEILDGKEASSRSFNPAPGLIAGSFRLKKLPKHHFGYSALPRYKVNYDLSTRHTTDDDGLSALPGFPPVKQEFAIQKKVNESWWGLTWSYRPHPRIGIGLTPYLAYRQERQSERALAATTLVSSQVASAIYINDFSYATYRLLAKTGITYEDSALSLGATLTLPSLHLSGDASTLFSLTQAGGDLNEDGLLDDRLITSNQEDIRAQYRSSWALGGGIAYRLPRMRLHASTEWYAGLAPYEILEVDTTLRSLGLRISHELQPVFNYGIGAEFSFIRNTRGYLSFATDRSSVPSSADANNIALVTFDFYRLSGGTSLVIGPTELVLGLSYSQGKQTLPTIFEFADELDEDLIQTGNTIQARFIRWKFIFGISVDL